MKESAELSALLQALMPASLAEIDLSLDRVARFLEECGNPQLRLPKVVHVAGTNGKGSTIAFLRSILEQAGYLVHVYTSPHLVNFCERIVIAGRQVDESTLLPVLHSVLARTKEIPLTFFEATTVAAFELFATHSADFTLLEVGMGGRLDATNLVNPVATVITPISRDHMEFLGNSIEAIASEKAGIIKAGCPVVVSAQAPEALAVITNRAKQLNAPLYRCGIEWQCDELSYQVNGEQISLKSLGLAGEHQCFNAATALAVFEAMGLLLPLDVRLAGLRLARWPARLQQLHSGELVELLQDNHELWLDGGHNEAGAKTIVEWAKTRKTRLHVVCGMINRKDAAAFLSVLGEVTESVYLIDIPNEKSTYSADGLLVEAQSVGLKAQTAPSLQQAVASIVEKTGISPTIIMICGSLYLAGRVLEKNH